MTYSNDINVVWVIIPLRNDLNMIHLFIYSSLTVFVQEVDAEHHGIVMADISEPSSDRLNGSGGKLCKTESQNHTSPRYTFTHIHTRLRQFLLMLQLCLVFIIVSVRGVTFISAGLCERVSRISVFVSSSKGESRVPRRTRSTSMKDRQNSRAQSDRTTSVDSEYSPDSRFTAQVRQI